MRNKPLVSVEKYRSTNDRFPKTKCGDLFGLFIISNNDATAPYQIRIVSSGHDTVNGWEHVSVSILYREGDTRNPTWLEMYMVKNVFWDPEETVIQFHPKASEYVNQYDTCLHLWKQIGKEHELPPGNLV